MNFPFLYLHYSSVVLLIFFYSCGQCSNWWHVSKRHSWVCNKYIVLSLEERWIPTFLCGLSYVEQFDSQWHISSSQDWGFHWEALRRKLFSVLLPKCPSSAEKNVLNNHLIKVSSIIYYHWVDTSAGRL